MSRFGRDYLQVGMYTDVLFPELGVHFVAVNDGVDSKRGENEFTAIRNVFNEMFARDTSKKIRATWQTKGKSGEHLCVRPPYGYMKDPADKKKWIVDEEAAAVVQRIFSLCVDGKGPSQIAKWLRQNGILTPTAYKLSKGWKEPNKAQKDPCRWSTEAVSLMLERVEYLGHTVNFKEWKPSYKSSKHVRNTPDKWAVFENTQEPIIEESVFLTVQNIRKVKRRPVKMGEPGIFSGLLQCSDCGAKLYLLRSNTIKVEQHLYRCATYNLQGKEHCQPHSIRMVVLEEIILRNLREAIAYVVGNETAFAREASENSASEQNKALARKKQSLEKAESRIVELDGIIKRLYEDNINGKLTDERFIKLSRGYEREQDELKAAAATLRADLIGEEKRKHNISSFIAVTRKYTNLKKLDAAVLREFIDKIYIHEKDKSTKAQKIEIVYNFIGAFDFEAAREQPKTNKNKAKAGVA
jgi:DNA invertase Pin-like site-specific DNA recombinase